MPVKYPNPCLIKIPRTFLQNYLGMSRNTISSCITHMCDTHVLKKRSNSSAMIFDAAYVMGVVSMINSADDDKVSQIADLFIAGDVDGLVKMGLKKVPNFNLPPVGAVDFEETAQILGKIDEEPKVMLCSGETAQILCNSDQSAQFLGNNNEDAQNLGISDENAQYLGKNIESAQILCNSGQNAQNLGNNSENAQILNIDNESAQFLGKNIETAQNMCSSDNIAQILTPQEIEIAQILGILYQKCTNFDTGEVVLSLGGGSIDQIRVFDPNFGQNQDKKLHKFWATDAQILTKVAQILTKVAQILGTVNNINNKIKEINQSYSEIEVENRLLKNHINVLFEKNQNPQVEASASINFDNLFPELRNSKREGDRYEEAIEEENEYVSAYNLIGEWVDCTVKEKNEFTQAKLNDPNCQLVYRTIKNELEEGQQLSGKEFHELVQAVVDEIIVIECSDPETGEYVEKTFESFVKGLGEYQDLSPEEQEEHYEMFKTLEIRRFCKKEYQKMFPHFQWEGRTVFAYFSPRTIKSDEERIEEFEALHSQFDHTFSEEEIALENFEKHDVLVKRFNERFPEDEEFLVADMVEAMRTDMIDIGLFSISGYEYDSYSILNGFGGMIRLEYDIDGRFAKRLKWKSFYDLKKEAETERLEKEFESLKSNANVVRSDNFDYGRLLDGFKRPRVKLTPEGLIPANPALVEAFKYLQFFDGKVLELWEIEQIGNYLLKGYNHLGTGISNFHNISCCLDCDWAADKFTVKNIGPQTVTEPATNGNEEADTYIPLPREKRRTTSRR